MIRHYSLRVKYQVSSHNALSKLPSPFGYGYPLPGRCAIPLLRHGPIREHPRQGPHEPPSDVLPQRPVVHRQPLGRHGSGDNRRVRLLVVRRDRCMVVPRQAQPVMQPGRSDSGFDYWLVAAAGHPTGMRPGKPAFLHGELGDERSQVVERIDNIAARKAHICVAEAALAPTPKRFSAHAKAKCSSFRG
jgi:hypothetical protein